MSDFLSFIDVELIRFFHGLLVIRICSCRDVGATRCDICHLKQMDQPLLCVIVKPTKQENTCWTHKVLLVYFQGH